jgi:hypothetical protein
MYGGLGSLLYVAAASMVQRYGNSDLPSRMNGIDLRTIQEEHAFIGRLCVKYRRKNIK